jgi:hypothetical protein
MQFLVKYTDIFFKLFLTRKKAQRDQDGGRILLGDNAGGGDVMFQCDGAWISAALPYTG